MAKFQKGQPKLENWYKAMHERIPWNKGIHVKNNNALEEWRKNGGVPWNKGKHTGVKPWLEKKRPNISGSNCYNWKGGITSINLSERVRFRKTIQKKVFSRDNYTCQLCGVTEVPLTVDHILSWSEYPKQRFSMNNCRTLCERCHYKITYGKPMPKKISRWGHNFKFTLKGGY